MDLHVQTFYDLVQRLVEASSTTVLTIELLDKITTHPDASPSVIRGVIASVEQNVVSSKNQIEELAEAIHKISSWLCEGAAICNEIKETAGSADNKFELITFQQARDVMDKVEEEFSKLKQNVNEIQKRFEMIKSRLPQIDDEITKAEQDAAEQLAMEADKGAGLPEPSFEMTDNAQMEAVLNSVQEQVEQLKAMKLAEDTKTNSI